MRNTVPLVALGEIVDMVYMCNKYLFLQISKRLRLQYIQYWLSRRNLNLFVDMNKASTIRNSIGWKMIRKKICLLRSYIVHRCWENITSQTSSAVWPSLNIKLFHVSKIIPDFDATIVSYRVSHLKLTKEILLWWRYRLRFLLILWILCVP